MIVAYPITLVVNDVAYPVAIVASIPTLVVALYLTWEFQAGSAAFQFGEDVTFSSGLDIGSVSPGPRRAATTRSVVPA